jgi:AraC-like DNA-binding protein
MPHDGGSSGAPCRIVFSSEALPAGLCERARRDRWRDTYNELYGPLEVVYARDRAFFADMRFTRIGTLGLTTSRSTVERFVRTRRCVAVAGADNFQLVLNRGRSPMLACQLGRETPFDPATMALLTDAESGAFGAGACNDWLFVTIPGAELAKVVRTPEDAVAAPLDHEHTAMRLLRRYLDLLLQHQEIEDDAVLCDHVETTLVDLLALALGAGREGAEVARLRGRRAARLRMILAEIGAGFEAPDFCVHTVAAAVGLSPRYVQDLLHETGRSFTERVLERRLQKARALLTDARLFTRRITDIALDSGFTDISYFNRMFRRRFGVSPSGVRSTG